MAAKRQPGTSSAVQTDRKLTPALTIRPKMVLAFLLLATVILAGLSIWGQYLRFYQRFVDIRPWMEIGLDFLNHKLYLDAETNIPTWFNSMLLLAAGMLFIVIAALKIQQRASFRWHWLGLGVLFTAMSVDEASLLHEMLIEPMRARFGLGGWFYFSWVIAGIAFLAFGAVVYAVFFLKLQPRFRFLILASLALYFAGAIGGEMLSGRVAAEIGQRNFRFAVFASIEESVELLGASLLIYSLLVYIGAHFPSLRVQVGEEVVSRDDPASRGNGRP